MDASTERDQILGRLRNALARPGLRFPQREPEPLLPEQRMHVTRAEGGSPELTARFQQELAALHGSSEVAASPSEARLALINRIMTWYEEDEAAIKGVRTVTGQEKHILGWGSESLPIDYLAESLADIGFTLVSPSSLAVGAARESVRHIRYGVTGVEAAFASTGSMLMATGPGRSRSASLLPYRHIALIPFSRVYSTLESWMSEFAPGELHAWLRGHANLTLITGPSKSADIEMRLTLGVHGPRHLHAIFFEDQVHDDESYDATWRFVPELDEEP